ncbi:Uncharacterised protein [Burkholderia pseudomallei]|nr:Uncharacterised protein [Burkholderia pseudomallei]CAJ6710895.1 Uncharacterised protein [Burkholderia pseudomallei]
MTVENILTLPAGEVMLKLGGRLLDMLRAARAETATPMANLLPDWMPNRAACHDNADAWVARHPADAVVRGWLYQRLDPLPEGDQHIFVAHSVIRTGAGDLIDVTLSENQPTGRFLSHPQDVVGFFALLLNPISPKEFKVIEPRAGR